MSTLEILDGENWESFINSPKSVLVLGKTDCPACIKWSQELETALGTDALPSDVRYGKLIINQKGLLSFKKANTWLAEVDTMPYTIIYSNGEIKKKYGGGGLDRLQMRLSRL